MNLPVIGDYQFEQLLGEGAAGQVYTAKNAQGPVAIKLLKRLAVNRKLLGYCLHRIKQFPHPNLVEIKDFSLEAKPMHVITSLHTVPGLNGLPEGYTLDSHSSSLDPGLVWSIITQIAEGMAHLHKYNCVHCSLNPKNVLVADQDQSLVKICDFGLGWVADISHIDLSEAFFYCSPEQLLDPKSIQEGQAVRWDVYAFGATAYRLLQKQYPRGGQYIERITNRPQDFQPGALAEAVSREPQVLWSTAGSSFETERRKIIDRCLDLDPSKRFVDMREVIVELRRLEQEEQVSHERGLARERESEVTAELAGEQSRARVFRLATYALAGVTAVSLIFNLTSGARSIGSSRRHSKELQTAEADAKAANSAKAAAEAEATASKRNLAEAQRMADSTLDFLLKTRESNSPDAKSVDGFLKAIRETQERFLASTQNDPGLLVERMRARLHLSSIDARMVNPDGRESVAVSLNKLASDLQVLPPDQQKNPKLRKVLAAAQAEIGRLRMKSGATRSAAQSLEQANAIYQQLAQEDPKDTDLRRRHARVAFEYGQLLARGSDPLLALAKQQEAMQLLQSLAQGPDSREEDEYYLAMSQIEVGLLRQWEAQGIEAFQAFQSASAGFSRLANEWGEKMPAYTFQLARCYYYLANLAFQEKGDDKEAKAARETAFTLLGKLLESDPKNQDYRLYLARTHGDFAEMYRNSGNAAEAAKSLDESLRLLDILLKESKNDPEFQYELARKTSLRAELALDAKDKARALAQAQEANRLMEDLAERNALPPLPLHIWTVEMAAVESILAQAHEANGGAAEAAKALKKASERLSALVTQRPNDTRARDALKALQNRGPGAA